MILYDKDCNFLGIGRDELSFAGFEDMEEFESYCDDFADLFEERKGYIFKFKDFSWIKFSLHSGASNKKVLVRHKNGSLIETDIKISEIFLNNSIGNSDIFYSIEILNNSSNKVVQNQTDTNSNNKSNFNKEETTQKTVAKDEFDFARIPEKTGLNLENIATFINEFMNESKKSIKSVQNSSDAKFIKNEIEKIKGIAIILKLHSAVLILDRLLQMLLEGNDISFLAELDRFRDYIATLERELS